ncbi:hypothetical protein K458DRAFT_423059 [Lentithecium fluviatile CBS 122367]|uniref:Uncharacterized protein n=1 Tax=Lentithecium fluviatile CBS 122367 TaxID=1168545 RepID=A0A6G1IJU2_9PLEO|nr:hypothetical protein K458DRAFT_423059 [Lentithecium fluviatile CBS 122367]
MRSSFLAITASLSLAAAVPSAPREPVKTCQEICYIEKPTTCGAGLYPYFEDPCWTCCSDAAAPSPSPSPTPPLQVCWAICYTEEPKCGRNMYPVKQGDCWTCCSKQ